MLNFSEFILWDLHGPNERAGSIAPALCVPKKTGNEDDRRPGRAAPALKGLMTELKSVKENKLFCLAQGLPVSLKCP